MYTTYTHTLTTCWTWTQVYTRIYKSIHKRHTHAYASTIWYTCMRVKSKKQHTLSCIACLFIHLPSNHCVCSSTRSVQRYKIEFQQYTRLILCSDGGHRVLGFVGGWQCSMFYVYIARVCVVCIPYVLFMYAAYTSIAVHHTHTRTQMISHKCTTCANISLPPKINVPHHQLLVCWNCSWDHARCVRHQHSCALHAASCQLKHYHHYQQHYHHYQQHYQQHQHHHHQQQ